MGNNEMYQSRVMNYFESLTGLVKTIDLTDSTWTKQTKQIISMMELQCVQLLSLIATGRAKNLPLPIEKEIVDRDFMIFVEVLFAVYAVKDLVHQKEGASEKNVKIAIQAAKNALAKRK
jgi:hypothetical protein